MVDAVGLATGTGSAQNPGEELTFLTVNGDSIDGGWTTQSGSTILFPSIDEHITPNDADYIVSSGAPSADLCKVSLGNLASGFPLQPFRVRYRTGKNGSRRVDLGVRLLQGVSEIAAWTHVNVSGVPTTVTQTLTPAQFALITNFSNLFLEFTADLRSGTYVAENGVDVYVTEDGANTYVTEDT